MGVSGIRAHLAWALVAVGATVSACSGESEGSIAAEPTDDGSVAADVVAEDAPAVDDATASDDTSATDGSTTSEVADAADAAVPGATPPNLKVAFVGDQGTNSNTLAVLNLIKKEGADFVILLGDFDYGDDPAEWEDDLTAGLGADFPVFGVGGNHDLPEWPAYQANLNARLAKIAGAKCTGDNGVKMACTYKGLFFLLSGVGTQGSGHEDFLESQLAADSSIWRVCAWHKNQSDMQIGGKGNEVGWKAYQVCQNGGAIVMTGHEHSYARTKTLTALGDRAKGHGAVGDPAELIVKAGALGSTFVVVSGLGGVGIRDYEASRHDDDTWWASYWAATTSTTDSDGAHLKNGTKLKTKPGFGATFVTFHVDGDPKKARGYFKSTGGVEIDRFEIRRE